MCDEPQSILDNDAYKFGMGCAEWMLYPDAEVEFKFFDRRPSKLYDDEFKMRLDSRIEAMRELQLRDSEYDFMRQNMSYLPKTYLDFLRTYRYNPDEVTTAIDGEGRLSVTVRGKWHRAGYWEVPLMKNISAEFFSDWRGHNKLWNYDGVRDRIAAKARTLSEAGCFWADFGTRRRRDFWSQDAVVSTMKMYKGFVGTSNVYLAMQHGVKPIGTMAHEWIQAHSVLGGIRHANRFALDAWSKVYRGDLGIALTDTFGTDAFFEDFDIYLAKLYDGLRQDSGCPFIFAEKAVEHYKKLGIDYSTKTIVFSDNLNAETCVLIWKHCQKLGIRCSFGIGTNLTNDYPNSKLKPLNMVIKMVELNGVPVVKLSDDKGKEIGDKDALRVIKWIYFGTPLDT